MRRPPAPFVNVIEVERWAAGMVFGDLAARIHRNGTVMTGKPDVETADEGPCAQASAWRPRKAVDQC